MYYRMGGLLSSPLTSATLEYPVPSARYYLSIQSPSTEGLNTWNLFIYTIHHRNNKRTIRRARLKELKNT